MEDEQERRHRRYLERLFFDRLWRQTLEAVLTEQNRCALRAIYQEQFRYGFGGQQQQLPTFLPQGSSMIEHRHESSVDTLIQYRCLPSCRRRKRNRRKRKRKKLASVVVSASGTHQVAEAQREKNARLKEAFGISDYFVEGSSLDPDRKAKEKVAEQETKRREDLEKQKEELEKKLQTLVKTPSPEPKHKKKHKRERRRKDSSSSSSDDEKEKEKRRHKGKSKHRAKDRSRSPHKKHKKDKKKKKSKRRRSSSSER